MIETGIGSLAEFYRLARQNGVLRMRRSAPGRVKVKLENRGSILKRFKVSVLSFLKPSRNADVNRQFIGLIAESYGRENALGAARSAGISNRRPLTSYKVRRAIGFLSSKGLTDDLSVLVAQKNLYAKEPDFRAMDEKLRGIIRSLREDSPTGADDPKEASNAATKAIPKAIDAYRVSAGHDKASVTKAFQDISQGFIPIGKKLLEAQTHLDRSQETLNSTIRSKKKYENGPNIKGSELKKIQRTIQSAEEAVEKAHEGLSGYKSALASYSSRLQTIASTLDSTPAPNLDSTSASNLDSTSASNLAATSAPTPASTLDGAVDTPSSKQAADNFRRIASWFASDSLLAIPRNFTLKMNDAGLIDGQARLHIGSSVDVLKNAQQLAIQQIANEGSQNRWTDDAGKTHDVSQIFKADISRSDYYLKNPQTQKRDPIFADRAGLNEESIQKGVENFEKFFDGNAQASFLMSRIVNQDLGLVSTHIVQEEGGIQPLISQKEDDAQSLMMLFEQSRDKGSYREYTVSHMEGGGYQANIDMAFPVSLLQSMSSASGILPIDQLNSKVTFSTTVQVKPEDLKEGKFQITAFRAEGNFRFDAPE